MFVVSPMKNGSNLNPYPIFLTILSCLTLCLCGTNIYFQFKHNRKNIYNRIVIYCITGLIVVLLFMGLIFYFGNIIESFMNISLNVKKVDQDFK
jgi:CDP-diglyceride synthetase